MKKNTALIALLLIVFSQLPTQGQSYSLPSSKPAAPGWSLRQPIYEANISRMTREGTFKAFEAQLPRLKALGVGIIWLMPIHKRGQFRVSAQLIDSLDGAPIPVPEAYRVLNGKQTSPYCISDHYSIHPEFGTKEDFRHLVDAIHQQGMYIILDLVVNHTSWDHLFIQQHPDFYARNQNGAVAYTKPWKDIAQLDWENKAMREYMRDVCRYWVREMDVDGFRTDVADRVPSGYWTWLRAELHKIKPVFLLAEGFSPAVHPAHDVSYDWFLPPAFWSVVEGKKTVAVIDSLLAWERRKYPKGVLKMRHATNHDVHGKGYAYPSMADYYDQVLEKTYFEQVPLVEKFGEGLKAFMVLSATLPNSVPMIWNGQEIGILQKTPSVITWQDNEWVDFYQKLFTLYRTNPAFTAGDFTRLSTGQNEKVYAFVRKHNRNKVLVMINCSPENQPVTFKMDGNPGMGKDFFSGKTHPFSKNNKMVLEPWASRVYVYHQ